MCHNVVPYCCIACCVAWDFEGERCPAGDLYRCLLGMLILRRLAFGYGLELLRSTFACCVIATCSFAVVSC
jgi:hypothetical protein